jgi:hypothetical protein
VGVEPQGRQSRGNAQPIKSEPASKLKPAKTLDIDVSQNLLAIADEVID